MKISIITPTHDIKFLKETWESIKRQSHTDWEWVIVPNGKMVGRASYISKMFNDERVRVVPFTEKTNFIGLIKNFAFNQGIGDILLELDHDDILTPWALEECVKAFTPDIDFVYSNTADFDNETGKPRIDHRADCGWKYREQTIDGRIYREALGFEPTPHSISYIWFAPNHFRAWRKSFYDRIGGHNKELRVCDDHELVIRTYLEGRMKHVDKN